MSREFAAQINTRVRGLQVQFGDYELAILANGEWLVAAYPKAQLAPPNAEDLAPPLRSFTLPVVWLPEDATAEPATIGPGAAELLTRHLAQHGEPIVLEDRTDRDPRHVESATGIVLQRDGALVWCHVWRDPGGAPSARGGALGPAAVARLREALVEGLTEPGP